MRRQSFARFRGPFQEFLRDQSTGAVFLFIMAVVAMIWANSPWKEVYHEIWEYHLYIGFDHWKLEHTLHDWINDGLMAMFFFVVGLELKREVVGGELSKPRQALLPVAAGLGGMIFPALIYLWFNRTGAPQDGWGIPMATDIAFAVGLMALLGSRAPTALKVFITTLAIADDLGAVLVIAVFYTSKIGFDNLLIGAGFLVMLVVGNRLGVRNPWFYAVIGIGGLWTAFLLSGIHATVAGVLAAFAIPTETVLDEKAYVRRIKKYVNEFAALEPNDLPTLTHEQLRVIEMIDEASEDAETPLQRLEQKLQPIVLYFVMPLFALANAGVELPDGIGTALTSSVAMGVGLGLVLGKPLGILLTCFLCIRMGWAKMSTSFGWRHLIGAAFLAGVGFTMSLFLNELAFDDPVLGHQAKLGILTGSLLAGIIGYVLLWRVSKVNSPSES